MVVFSLFDRVPVYSFSFILAVSVSFGLGYCLYRVPRERRDNLFDSALLVLVAGLVGSRTFFWLFSNLYPPVRSGGNFSGGQTWIGALLGAWLGLLLAGLLEKSPWEEVAHRLLPLAAILAVGAWLGCWLEGVAYGAVTSAWGALPAIDETGQVAWRVPVQLIGAVASLILIFILEEVERIEPKPAWLQTGRTMVYLWLLGQSLLLFWLTEWRADSLPAWGQIPLDILAVGLLIGVSLIGLGTHWVHFASRSKQTQPDGATQ